MQFSLIVRYSCGFSVNFLIAAAAAAGVGSLIKTPVLPSDTSSAIPPLFIVITGTPIE